MNASHSISHLLDEIFTPELLAVFVVQIGIRYPFTSQTCFTGRLVMSLMQPSRTNLVYLPLARVVASTASAKCSFIITLCILLD